MIALTELAIAKIKEMSEELSIGHTTVRVKILGQGCAGFAHDMSFEDIISEDTDEIFEMGGVKVVIDQMSLQYLENVQIDYVSSEFGGGFKFGGPDIKSTCGCGKSVSY